MISIMIRNADSRDVEILLALWLELMHHHKAWNPSFIIKPGHEENVRTYLANRLNDPLSRIFIAMDDNEPVGFLIASFSIGNEAFSIYKKGYIGETFIRD